MFPRSKITPMVKPTGRLPALDGLRGVAAVTVLVHHSLLVIPAIAADRASAAWIVRSPLHLFWAGNEAVYVFFILSGLVLTLPALRRGRMHWKPYYPSRLLRLYVPVVASVGFAIVLALIVPRVGMQGRSVWMQSHQEALTLGSVARNVSLLAPDWLNSPLWSLKWEVAFSLLLPVYLLVTKWTRHWFMLMGVAALILSSVGSAIGSPALTFLPMFMIRSAVASAVCSGRVLVRNAAWPWIMLASALGITLSWWAPGFLPPSAAFPVVLASASGFVLSAVYWPPMRAVLQKPTIQWLGKISFSLYLVHEPVVVSVGLLLPAGLAWLAPVLAVPLALVAGWWFFRLVEAPAHRLAKRSATWIALKDRSVKR